MPFEAQSFRLGDARFREFLPIPVRSVQCRKWTVAHRKVARHSGATGASGCFEAVSSTPSRAASSCRQAVGRYQRAARLQREGKSPLREPLRTDSPLDCLCRSGRQVDVASGHTASPMADPVSASRQKRDAVAEDEAAMSNTRAMGFLDRVLGRTARPTVGEHPDIGGAAVAGARHARGCRRVALPG